MRLGVVSIMLGCLLLTGCPKSEMGSENISSDDTAASAASDPEMLSDPISPKSGEVDRSCKADADCAVKDVGNCCGYYPACVNRDSPTFPAQVKAQCEAEGRMSICGFKEIAGCTCVEGRCTDQAGDAGTATPVQ